MTDEQSPAPEAEPNDLEDLDGDVLPDREVMSIVELGGPEAGPIFTLPVEPPEQI